MSEATVSVGRRRPLLHIRTAGAWTPIAAAAFIALVTAIALLAPVLAPHDPQSLDLGNANAAPSTANLLGTDGSGRDLLSRLIWGARSALLGPLIVVVVATVLGSTLALIAAWRGGWADGVINASLNLLFAFPAILLAVLAVAVFGSGLGAAVIAISIAYIPYVARIVRSEALRHRSFPYIEASEIQGATGVRVVLRHLLPNVLPLIIAQATVSFGYAMVDLAAISYLGLGVQAPTPDWGLMVAEGGEGLLAGHYAESLLSGGLIVMTVVAFTVLGDHLGERAGRTE